MCISAECVIGRFSASIKDRNICSDIGYIVYLTFTQAAKVACSFFNSHVPHIYW